MFMKFNYQIDIELSVSSRKFFYILFANYRRAQNNQSFHHIAQFAYVTGPRTLL